MIVRFCPGYSYARKCNGRCDECKDIIEKDMEPWEVELMFEARCRPPVLGHGSAEEVKIMEG